MFEVFGFYKFVKIFYLKKNQKVLLETLKKKNIRGTIIISKEGVNGTISGKAEDIKFTINNLKRTLKFKEFNSSNLSKSSFQPFHKPKVKIKNEKFDLVFIDADKMNYIEYYERSLELLYTSGLIIIDNVLWYGEVVNENNNDKITKNIKEFNSHISKDTRVEKLIIPLGDGLTVCRKL